MPDQDKPEKSLRLQRREERMDFVRKAKEPRKVRVTPAREELRKLLKHPNAGGFRSSGSVEWPLDTFTKRRIKDGDVTVEEREQNKPGGEEPAAPSATGGPST